MNMRRRHVKNCCTIRRNSLQTATEPKLKSLQICMVSDRVILYTIELHKYHRQPIMFIVETGRGSVFADGRRSIHMLGNTGTAYYVANCISHAHERSRDCLIIAMRGTFSSEMIWSHVQSPLIVFCYVRCEIINRNALAILLSLNSQQRLLRMVLL